MNRIKLMFLETRPHFLILTPVCVFLGVAIAVHKGYFNPAHLILVLAGSVFAHASVNVFNDYYDYLRGTDLITKRTPFSGGSGFIPAGFVKPKEAFNLATSLLVLGLLIGIYFMVLYPILIPIVLIGIFLVYAYTPLLTRVYITEVFPGLGFGLMVVGTYVTMIPPNTSADLTVSAVAAVVPGILISNLLLLNEFPDYEADKKTGRRHLVVVLGRRRASKIYVLLIAFTYVWIVFAVAIGFLPVTALISIATIPIAVKACIECLKYYDRVEKLIPALAKNVLVTLLTPTLLAVGFLLDLLI